MGILKVGYRAVYYVGKEVMGEDCARDSYEAAEKDIENEIESSGNFSTFTHAKVEKIYYR